MKNGYPKLSGKLKIYLVPPSKDEPWSTIMIDGDPLGLGSFAKVLVHLAKYNQEKDQELPIGSREHCEVNTKFLLKNSNEVILSRLDPKRGLKKSRPVQKI